MTRKQAAFLFFLSAAALCAAAVPPVTVEDVKVQRIGEERWLEELPENLVFVDAETGKLCVADENDPHGRNVCVCRDIDWHGFTNDLKVNGHKILFNQFWSQAAEGGSLVYRFGTNAWLRLAGASSGSLANMAVDAFDATNGTMTVTADTTAGTLQVCTNLLEADAWKTAANATVAATTDASTTWNIALLGTAFETYRVLAEVQREAGIHAERTLHANAGIEMGGVRWDAWPTNHATVQELNAASNALSGRFADYLPLNGGVLTNDLTLHTNGSASTPGIIFDRGGETTVDWRISNANGILLFQKRSGDDGAWSWGDGRCIKVDGSTATVTAPGFVGSGDGLTVNSTNLAEWAEETTERVGALEALHEWPETCMLYWPTNYVAENKSGSYIPVPTNFPAKRLLLVVNDEDMAALNISVPTNWMPGRAVTIDILPVRENGITNRSTFARVGTSPAGYVTSSSAYRLFRLEYDPILDLWWNQNIALNTRFFFFGADRAQAMVPPDGTPATVADWTNALAGARSGQALSMQPAPSLSPGLSPGLSPLSPAVLQPEGLDALDGPEQPEEEPQGEPEPEEEMR